MILLDIAQGRGENMNMYYSIEYINDLRFSQYKMLIK